MLIGLRRSVSIMKAKWQCWSLSELLHVAWRTPHWKLTSSSYYCYESFIPHCRVKTPVPPLPISVETHLLTLYLSFLLGNIGAIIVPTSRVDMRAVSQALELCYLNISGLCTCVVPRSVSHPATASLAFRRLPSLPKFQNKKRTESQLDWSQSCWALCSAYYSLLRCSQLLALPRPWYSQRNRNTYAQ